MYTLFWSFFIVSSLSTNFHLKNFFQRQKDNALKVLDKSKYQLLQNAKDLNQQLKDDVKTEKKFLKDNFEKIKKEIIQKVENESGETQQTIEKQIQNVKDELNNNFNQAKQAGDEVFDRLYSGLRDESKKICDEEDQDLVEDLIKLIHKKKDRETQKMQQKHEHMLSLVNENLDQNLKNGKEFIRQQLDHVDETIERQFKENDELIDQMIDQKFKQADQYINSQKTNKINHQVQFHHRNPQQDQDWQQFQEHQLDQNQLDYVKNRAMNYIYNAEDLKFQRVKRLECDNKYYQTTKDLKCMIVMVFESNLVHNHVHEIEVLFQTEHQIPEVLYISHIN